MTATATASRPRAGERVELRRYRLPDGDRMIVGQRIGDRVALIDTPVNDRDGRVYLIERNERLRNRDLTRCSCGSGGGRHGGTRRARRRRDRQAAEARARRLQRLDARSGTRLSPAAVGGRPGATPRSPDAERLAWERFPAESGAD